MSTKEGWLRIEILTLLNGVNWPTASGLLHFAFWDQYLILDFRALWSLKVKVPNQYDFEFMGVHRGMSAGRSEAEVDMRTLDRALWQYSSENKLR